MDTGGVGASGLFWGYIRIPICALVAVCFERREYIGIGVTEALMRMCYVGRKRLCCCERSSYEYGMHIVFLRGEV